MKIFSTPNYRRFPQNIGMILTSLDLITSIHRLPRTVFTWKNLELNSWTELSSRIQLFGPVTVSVWNKNLKSFAHFMDLLFGLENIFQFWQWGWNFNTLLLLSLFISHSLEYFWHIISMKWKWLCLKLLTAIPNFIQDGLL